LCQSSVRASWQIRETNQEFGFVIVLCSRGSGADRADLLRESIADGATFKPCNGSISSTFRNCLEMSAL
jgi:hypothetical protein